MNILNNYNPCASGIGFDLLVAMNYSPKILAKEIENRLTSSLLFVAQGEYKYKCADSQFFVKSGDMIYLPKNSKYRYEIISAKAYSLQIEFDLFDGGEPFLLSNQPSVVLNGGGSEIEMLFFDIIKGKDSTAISEKLMSDSAFLRLLAISMKGLYSTKYPKNNRYDKIAPAVNYIESRFTEKITVQELAALCSLSQTHMRRLFLKELGMPPIKYKNKLLMKNACDLLKTGAFNVSEVANALYFKDLYTFSQIFKRETGKSPLEFIKLNK